jgi:hypothetical protein
MKYLKFLALGAALSFGMASCEYEHPVPPPVSNEPVSFADDIIPYFDASCNTAGCHDPSAFDPDLSAANAYTSLFQGGYIDTLQPEASSLYVKLLPGASMANYSTPAETAMLLKWIQEGAKNN